MVVGGLWGLRVCFDITDCEALCMLRTPTLWPTASRTTQISAWTTMGCSQSCSGFQTVNPGWPQMMMLNLKGWRTVTKRNWWTAKAQRQPGNSGEAQSMFENWLNWESVFVKCWIPSWLCVCHLCVCTYMLLCVHQCLWTLWYHHDISWGLLCSLSGHRQVHTYKPTHNLPSKPKTNKKKETVN